uniref:Major facilitator superfamily (MFS) profile domain-containing protein n=1 Tax=Pristionchus pacificus TaxID=54126 RepID=A0A8R1UCA4_PRIPA
MNTNYGSIHSLDTKMTSTAHSIRLIAILFLLAVAVNWQYGFSSTYLNTPVDQFKEYLNESLGGDMSEGTYNLWWDLIQNIWFVGFFIGIFLNPVLNDRLGRRYGMMIANSFILIASIMQFLAVLLYIPILLIIGRAIASTFTAVAFQAVVLYLQESPPTHIRGTASFLSEISFALFTIEGTMLGTDELLGNNLPWLTASVIPICAFSVVILFFVPETSKFLLMSGADRSVVEHSVRFFHGPDANVATILKETEIEIAEEAISSTWSSILDLVRIPHLRKALILAVCCLQNCVALWTFIYNSTLFLEDINIDSGIAKWAATAMCVSYFVCTVIGGTFVDRWGRRKILIPFSYMNVACIAVFTLFSQLQKLQDFWKYFGVATLILFAGSYGCGVGAISWFISSELTPIKYRTLMQSACYGINTVSVVISTFVVLPFYFWIGTYCFLILYCLPSAFALIYITRNLPETRGREIHDIVNELRG